MSEPGDTGFWPGRRVFVTGHTGFKGSWLCQWLKALRADVAGFALPPATNPNLFTQARLESRVRSSMGDLRDATALLTALQAQRPSVVFHLAAQALVSHGYRDPVATYHTNAAGTANVLEAIRHVASVRAVVVVTSDKCYARPDHNPAGEDDRHAESDALGGDDPYSASKACAELITAAYRASFFARGVYVATARAGNVIGGGDWSDDRVIPDAVRAFSRHQPVVLRRPAAVRPWQHVLDPLRGYLMLAEALHERQEAFAHAWNLGPPRGHEVRVCELVERFAAAWGGGASWRPASAESVHMAEAAVLRLNSDKAAAALGWHARIPLHDALAATAAWYRRHSDGRDASDLMDDELERWEATAAV